MLVSVRMYMNKISLIKKQSSIQYIVGSEQVRAFFLESLSLRDRICSF